MTAFGIITRQAIRLGTVTVTSVKELVAAIGRCMYQPRGTSSLGGTVAR